MEKAKISLSALSDQEILTLAAQLATAASASLPRYDDDAQALERSRRLFGLQLKWLLALRNNYAHPWHEDPEKV